MKNHFVFFGLFFLLTGFVFWLNILPAEGKARHGSGSDGYLDEGPEHQTALAEDLTRIDEYFYPGTPTRLPYHYAMKTQLWCERADQDSLSYKDKLVCGLTPQGNEPRWPKQTQAFLEGCKWQGNGTGSSCPPTPLKTPDPYKYTVTPEWRR